MDPLTVIAVTACLLTLIFGFLFLAARRVIGKLIEQEILLATFQLVDPDAPDAEKQTRMLPPVHVYCLGVAGADSALDEALMLLKKTHPQAVIKNVAIRPLGVASHPVASVRRKRES